MAHNGTMTELHKSVDPSDPTHVPVGDTDSELAFCLLLEKMRGVWAKASSMPPWQARFDAFMSIAAELATYGTCNILYSDGDALFAHAHKRIYELVDGQFGAPEPPGLSIRNCANCDQAPNWSCDGLEVGLGCQETIFIASVPLDDDGWEPLPEASAIVMRQGKLLQQARTLEV